MGLGGPKRASVGGLEPNKEIACPDPFALCPRPCWAWAHLNEPNKTSSPRLGIFCFQSFGILYQYEIVVVTIVASSRDQDFPSQCPSFNIPELKKKKSYNWWLGCLE